MSAEINAPTAYALLRDRSQWSGERRGLRVDRDGGAQLALVPSPANGLSVNIAVALPYAREVSGIAVGACESVFVADTVHDQIIYIDGRCGASATLPARTSRSAGVPGGFRAPRGLALAIDRLLVGDSGNGRVQHLAFPGLEPFLATGPWGVPTSVTVDVQGRMLAIDAASGRLHRFSESGATDTAFATAVAAHGLLKKPLFVVSDDQARVLVSDADADAVFVITDDGASVEKIVGPPGWLPGALAVSGRRLYVADASNAAILVFDNDELCASLKGWSGPVTAMAVDERGALYIKPGLDAVYYRFEPDSTCVRDGWIQVGPLDAGESRDWVRVVVDADVPAGTSVTVRAALKDTLGPLVAGDWRVVPSLDALLALDVTSRRFAWLRVELASENGSTSPRLRQVHLATAEEDLREYLPQVFSRVDDKGLLTRWLQLVRGEFGRVEQALDDMPRVADPKFAAATALTWLAQWLAFELPQIAGDDERRALLERAVAMFGRRGTRVSIAEFVELHTGIRPTIVEAFNDRHVWQLGVTSRLGFDTQLAPLDPNGMVVPDSTAAACCAEGSEALMCAPCEQSDGDSRASTGQPATGAIGRIVAGESGPLAEHQIGLPLFAEDAYKFCVLVDGYRATDGSTRREIARIVEREKPAHTDFRIDYVDPDARVGLQARIGVDLIIGGDPPALRLGETTLGVASRLPPTDVSRVGATAIDGTLTLG